VIATVVYHREPEGWWAETDALRTFSAADATYEAVRARVLSALPQLLGDSLEIREDLSEVGIDVPLIVWTVRFEGSGFCIGSSNSVASSPPPSSTRGEISVGSGRVDAKQTQGDFSAVKRLVLQ
jgi:hypothetical protein